MGILIKVGDYYHEEDLSISYKSSLKRIINIMRKNPQVCFLEIKLNTGKSIWKRIK